MLKQVLSESLVETQRTSEEDVTFYWVLRPWGFMSKPSSSSKVLRETSEVFPPPLREAKGGGLKSQFKF